VNNPVRHLNHEREISDLRPGSHILCLYDSEEEHRAWVTPFLAEGLQRGERVNYVLDQHSAETIVDYLRAAEVETEPYLASGQLNLLDARQLLFSEGRFDPDTALRSLTLEIERAVEQGCTGLRVSWEMSWATHRRAGSGRLMEFECKANAAFADELFIGLCQYDRRRFSPAQLLEAIAVHPEITSDRGRHRNIFFATPRHVAGECAATDLLEHRLEVLAARTEATRRLEEEVEMATEVIDALEVMVAVLDRQGRIMFLNRAWEEAWGQDLARQRGRPLWEMGGTAEERAALWSLLDVDAAVAFPRCYTGRLALNGAAPRAMICTAQLLSLPAGRQRVVVTARET
jgi:PAS domain-containing protein